jgi:hypothetical protein
VAECAGAFAGQDWERARTQMLAGLVNFGRHTITGSLATAGLQQADWSSSYRALQRLPADKLFAQVQKQTLAKLGPKAAWVVAMDDSLLRKSGRLIPGCRWLRDPMSPGFSVNFTWGQRILQFSAAIPGAEGSARLIPVDWRQAPLPQKPRKKATAAELGQYQATLKQANLNRVAARAIGTLRQSHPEGPIHFVTDGRFTNKTLLRALPPGTVLIGRIRKDSVLHECPIAPQARARGRPRRYGPLLPTPEALRTEETRPWQEVSAWAVDRRHRFRIKTLGPIQAPICGVDKRVRLVVIAPVAYQLRKGAKLLYRQPAHLLCTDPDLPVEKILQEFLWRWDIEVNFRDEKTLLGVGQAQLRNPQAIDRQPAAAVAAYSFLLLASLNAFPDPSSFGSIPLPLWRKRHPPRRPTTNRLISELRKDLWAHCLNPTILSHFSSDSPSDHNPFKINSSLAHAAFYCTN